MKIRDLYWFLGLELFAIVWAGAVFSLVPNRLYAGGLAGLYFVVSAAWMLARAWSWPDKWRSLTMYPLLLHLFGVSLPMLITRFLNADLPFEQVHIWGLDGPQFHHLSGMLFTALVAATVLDWLRLMVRMKRA